MSEKSIFYKSGDMFLPKPIIAILDYTFIGDVEKSFYVNGWSLLHMFSGCLVAYFLLFKSSHIYLKAFLIHTLWELWQVYIGMAKPFLLTGHSSLVDMIVDTIFFMFGVFLIQSKIGQRGGRTLDFGVNSSAL